MDGQPTSFQKLPAEMLGYIFERCIEDDLRKPGREGLGDSPWLLAQVCRHWYQIAKGTPSLWRKILVTDTTQSYWTLNRNLGRSSSHHLSVPVANARLHSSMQVCVNSQQLSNALRRGGAASLEITLSFNCTYLSSLDQLDAAFYQELYNMVFSSHVTPRISHLVADSRYKGELDFLFWPSKLIGSISLPRIALPALISLQIHSIMPLIFKKCDGTSMLREILESSKQLQDLHLGVDRIPPELESHTWISSSYRDTIQNLKEIRVVHPDTLDMMLDSSLRIEVLVIDGATRFAGMKEESMWSIKATPWPTPRTPVITFECLKNLHLILDDFSLLDHLNFSLLYELRLMQSSSYPRVRGEMNGVGSPPIRPDFILQLPSLRSLRVTSPNIAPLNRFDMPHLEKLHITSTQIAPGKADADFAALISGTTPPTSGVALVVTNPGALFLAGVRDLHIRSVMSEKGSISTLKTFTSLQTLYLVPGKKMGKSLVQELTMTKHKQDTARVICPELIAIEIDCHSFHEWDKKARRNKKVGTTMPEGLHGVIEKLVESRKKWGGRLEHCILTATDGTKIDYAEG